MVSASLYCALLVGVAVTATIAHPQGPKPPTPPARGKCPRSSAGIGICTFNPEINCAGDDSCKSGQICCPDGCNRICKEPEIEVGEKEVEEAFCPLAGIQSFGICVFDPKVNCVENNECPSGQLCCQHGCNKICKNPIRKATPPKTAVVDDRCPPVPGNLFGACVFNPEVNCLDDAGCSNGEICCANGCGKICKKPKVVGSNGVGVGVPPENTDNYKNPESTGSKCPPTSASSSIGTCLFNPAVNCVSDSNCKNGKVCCPSGCSSRCVNPLPTIVPYASKP